MKSFLFVCFFDKCVLIFLFLHKNIAPDKALFSFNWKVLIFFFFLHESIWYEYSLQVPQHKLFCRNKKNNYLGLYYYSYLSMKPYVTVLIREISNDCNWPIWCFTPLSTLFKSYRDDGRVIMKHHTLMSWISPTARFEPGTTTLFSC